MADPRHNGALDRHPLEPSADETDAAAAERPGTDFAERVKQLDFEQRARLRNVAPLTLSLRFLRTFSRRMWTGTSPAAAATVPHPPPGSLALTFVGHATVMITTPETRVLTDPLLESWLCGLRRVRAAAVDPRDLADTRLILISHAHRDHLSRQTLRRLPRAATIVLPPGCESLVADLGFAQVVELDTGQSFAFADTEIVAVPVRHPGARGPFDRQQRGANGYIVRTQGRTVFFAGDTGYFSGFSETGRRFDPDLALLPISGYQPAPFRDDHLSPLDAVYALEDLGARVLVPITHGSFEVGYEPIHEPLAWLRGLAQDPRRGPWLKAALTILDHGQTCLLR